MKKQFDLKYYLEHPETKVVTRDGRSVRILCTDLVSDDYPIAAIFIGPTGSEDDIDTYAIDGKAIKDSSYEHNHDLLLDLPDPVKKRVPLTYEDLMERVKTGKSMWVIRPKCAVLILGFHDAKIKCAINFDNDQVRLFAYSDLMEWGEFGDGDPTWKEVEE